MNCRSNVYNKCVVIIFDIQIHPTIDLGTPSLKNAVYIYIIIHIQPRLRFGFTIISSSNMLVPQMQKLVTQ